MLVYVKDDERMLAFRRKDAEESLGKGCKGYHVKRLDDHIIAYENALAIGEPQIAMDVINAADELLQECLSADWIRRHCTEM